MGVLYDMFGYVKPYRPALVTLDNEFYRALYCGVCRAMKEETGLMTTFSLNYDFVFLAAVRLLVEENHISIRHRRCAAHPFRRRPMVSLHPATSYAARVSSVLVYHKLMDDIHDKGCFGSIKPKMSLSTYRRARKRAALGELDTTIADCISRLSETERALCPSIDVPATIFGELLGAVFAWGVEGEVHDTLYKMGHALGKFIYAADAADDFDDDVKSGSYNPFVLTYGKELSDETKRDIHASLLFILSEGEAAFRSLPFGNTLTVRRLIENVLYDGLPRRIAFLIEGKKKKKKHIPYDGVLP